MPFLGLGINLLIALFFAVHAVRTRQSPYWLLVLFLLPLLGSAIYFFTVYYQSSARMQRQGHKVAVAAEHIFDPGRALREAQQAWELAPTAANRLGLAAAQMQAGEYALAAQSYGECLQGPFANDIDIQLNAAKAHLLAGQTSQALAYLHTLGQEDQGVREEEVAILLAQSLAADGQDEAARAQFESTASRFDSFQAYAEYGIWAAERGDRHAAQQIQAEIERITGHWDRAQRALNADTMQRLTAAYKKLEP